MAIAGPHGGEHPKPGSAHPPECTATKLPGGGFEVTCPDGTKAHFAYSGTVILAEGGMTSKGGFTRISPGRCEDPALPLGCLTGQQKCDLMSYINSVPEPWPPWVERSLALPLCQGETEGQGCQPPGGDFCAAMKAGCVDANPVVNPWRPYLCSVSWLCSL